MSDEKREPADAMVLWPRVPLPTVRKVVRQRTALGCGAACVVMLLDDRGIVSEYEDVADRLMMPSRPRDLASELGLRSGRRWQGGSLPPAHDVTWELLHLLSRTRGTWAALLEPSGLGTVGHWIVVDGVSQDGLVLVRDPAGESYGLPLASFVDMWGYTVLVIEAENQ